MKHLEKDAAILATQVIELYKVGKPDDAKALCDEKVLALLARYAPSTVTKDCSRIYRKAIAIEAGIDPKTYRFTDKPMCLFQVPIELTTAVNDTSRDAVEAQRDVLCPITQDIMSELLEVGKQLVTIDPKKGQDFYNIAMGLVLLTGRRPYAETLHYARFETVNNYSVEFTGQAKGGSEKRETAFTIPVLGCDASVIVNAQNLVTNYIQSRPWYTSEITEKEISGNCKKQAQQCINTYIDPIFEPVRASGLPGCEVGLINPHDLRKAYAFIVWVNQNKMHSSFTQFAPKILGHSYTVKHSGKVRANTRSSESYEKFRLVESL